MRSAIALSLLLLAACGPTPEEKAAADARAVAEVKANQAPPPIPLTLDPIRFADIEKHDLFGAGCSFVPDGAGPDSVALAMGEGGYLIRDGELLRFAPDAGSAELPYLARQKYTGREFSFTLDLDEAQGKQSGEETIDYPGELTVRDSSDRVVYSAKGVSQCGA